MGRLEQNIAKVCGNLVYGHVSYLIMLTQTRHDKNSMLFVRVHNGNWIEYLSVWGRLMTDPQRLYFVYPHDRYRQLFMSRHSPPDLVLVDVFGSELMSVTVQSQNSATLSWAP